MKLGTSFRKFSTVTEKKGVKRGLNRKAIVPDVMEQSLDKFQVPDWVLLRPES